MGSSFLATIHDPISVITPIDAAARFPENLGILTARYRDDIDTFCRLVAEAGSSADLLRRIRGPSYLGKRRMALLKIFRRCVAPVLDTEMAKKVSKVSTDVLVAAYGNSFKPIELLKQQFASPTVETRTALAMLMGEYDARGQAGYTLTGLFFEWFEDHFEGVARIEGPRGAGRDIELSRILTGFSGEYPCDLAVRNA